MSRVKRTKIPSTPEIRAGFQDQTHVQSVLLRMGKSHVKALDELCAVNGRSRREIVEILVSEAYIELRDDKSARITPL